MRHRRRRSSYSVYARKNWFARNKVLIIIISALIVLAIAAGLYFVLRKTAEPEKGIQYEVMTTSSLPTVEFVYGEHEVNILHGYTQEMDLNYVRRNIYVLEDTYDVPVRISLYGNETPEVTFRLVDAENNNLIQDGSCDDFELADDVLSGTIKIDNLIDEGKEYVLDIQLLMTDGSPVYYYTRLKKDASTSLADQLEMALYFNACTYNLGDEEAEDYITGKLETNYWKNDNTNFGYIDIYSTVSAIQWAKLRMQMEGEPQIEILDVDDEIGYFRLNYTVTRTEGDDTEYYRVSEYYRLRVSAEYQYVLNYERTTDQIFIPEAEDAVATKSAKLGILSNDDVEMLCNYDGNLSCFVANDTLWAMDTDNKIMKKIFSFSSGIDDIRGNYDQNDIKLINVSNDGNIQFIVYGYMNAGLHEGRVGIGMYTYNAQTEKVEEEIFIPTNRPYEILKNSVGSLFYLGENNNLYIMMDHYLYKFSIGNDQAELITDELTEGSYIIHTEGKIIAWQNGGKANDASQITVLNMETGNQFVVNADSGCSIKVLGFLNQDLVYGQGKSSDIYTDDSGTEHLLMTDMYVIDENKNIQTQTNSGEGYFVGAVDEYNRVILKTVVERDGVYDNSDDYTLFATELDAYPDLESYTDYEELKRTVIYVEFADSTTSAGDLKINENAVVLFTDAKTTDVRDMIDDAGKYYVYAKGEVQSLETEPAEAIKMAYDQCGFVLKDDGTLFYKRDLIPATVELSSVTKELALEKIKNGEMLNVTGISLAEAMYYTGSRIAFVWENDEGRFLFTAYDYYDNITMYNVDTGEERIVASSDIEDTFAETGHTYIVE